VERSLPPIDAVRIEELVNFFRCDPSDSRLGIEGLP
jgi:hypothetical protein